MATGEPDYVQLDLFSAAGVSKPAVGSAPIGPVPRDPVRLSNGELIDSIPRSGQRDAAGLIGEATRRGLADAVPALEALCRRFSGFGLEREVAEQVAALHGLAAIGGADAPATVARLIVSGAVQGPGLLEAAGTPGSRPPAERVVLFLRDNDPAVRQAACRCAPG